MDYLMWFLVSVIGLLIVLRYAYDIYRYFAHTPSANNASRVMRCPECEIVTSVAEWCTRPICVHSWVGGVPEIWDGDNVDGLGQTIEESPNEEFRTPGSTTWTEMKEIQN